MRYLLILALLAQAPTPKSKLLYWECNGVVHEVAVSSSAVATPCPVEVFTIADGGQVQHIGQVGEIKHGDGHDYQPSAPKPLPTPPKIPFTLDNHGSSAIYLQDNGRTVVTVMDADIPVGPCDLGKLVRAVKAHLSLEHDSWQLKYGAAWTEHELKRSKEMDDLKDQLARCSPKEK